MLHRLKVLTLSAMLMTMSLATFAQMRSNKVAIKNVGMGFGYYAPQMDYWKNSSPWELGGGLMPSLMMEAALSKKVFGRVTVSYFTTSNEAYRDQSLGDEKMSVSLIPLSLNLIAPFEMANRYMGYGGIGVDFMAVSSTYSSAKSKQTSNNGIAPTGNILLGIQKEFGDYHTFYSLGIESKYLFGSYNHLSSVAEVSTPINNKVSLNGLYVGFVFKYHLTRY